MTRKELKKENRSKLSRSFKLRKYGSVYKKLTKYMKESVSISPTRKKKVKRLKKDRNPTNKKIERKKVKTSYQKFVKDESKKKCYDGMSGKKRIEIIAKKWNKQKITKEETKPKQKIAIEKTKLKPKEKNKKTK